jgi:hypothetical protein
VIGPNTFRHRDTLRYGFDADNRRCAHQLCAERRAKADRSLREYCDRVTASARSLY